MDMSVIVAGFGGQGALLAGIILCHAAVIEGKKTTWIPSYGAEMRGGAVNCAVNISDDEIGSPVIDKADFVIAMNDVSQIKFEDKVKNGGCMIINSSLSNILQYLFSLKSAYILTIFSICFGLNSFLFFPSDFLSWVQNSSDVAFINCIFPLYLIKL